jgi:hypothetical protein
MNISIVIPTTFGRPDLLTQAIKSCVDKNPKCQISVFVVKNGTVPNDDWYTYDIPGVVLYKLNTHPGGYVGRAVNRGLDEAYKINPSHDYVLITEDDIVCTAREGWLTQLCTYYNRIPDIGFLGNRMHGSQERDTNQRPWGYKGLPVFDSMSWQVWWNDGIQLISAEKLKNYRWDESYNLSGEWAEIQMRMRRDGLCAYYTHISMEHHSIRGDPKLIHCHDPATIMSSYGDWFLYEKFKDDPDEHIRNFAETDLKEAFDSRVKAEGPWTIEDKEVIVFGPWVGEFCYEFSWWAPRLRKLVEEKYTDHHIVHIGFAGRDIFYEDFCDEIVTYPPEIAAAIGESVAGLETIPPGGEKMTGSPAAEGFFATVMEDLRARFRDQTIITPHTIKNVVGEGLEYEDTFVQEPWGTYKSLSPSKKALDYIDQLELKTPYVFMLPRHKLGREVNLRHNWRPEEWHEVAKHLNSLGYAAYTIDHHQVYSDNLIVPLKLPDVDAQLALMEKSEFCLMGPSGAAVLSYLMDKKSIVIMNDRPESKTRFTLKWQKRMLSGSNRIVVYFDNFKTMTSNDICRILDKVITIHWKE